MLRLIFIVLLFSEAASADLFNRFHFSNYVSPYYKNKNKDKNNYIVFNPSAFYYQTEEDNLADTGSLVASRYREVYFYDLKAGYLYNNWYSGLIYSGESQNINHGSPKADRQSIGLSLGYLWENFLVSASIYPYSILKLKGALDVVQYKKGMGFQTDLAYYWHITNYLVAGPQLTYKYIKYKEADRFFDNQAIGVSAKHSTITPMVSLIFRIHKIKKRRRKTRY